VLPGTQGKFDVTFTVQSLSAFKNADALIGSAALPGGASRFTFTYSTEWNNAFVNKTTPAPFGMYNQDIFVGGNTPTVAAGYASLLVGTLTIDTTGLPPNTNYALEINPNVFPSVLGNSPNSEPLAGSTILHVIPEPASLMLVGLGAAAMLRRRRA